MIEIDEIYFNYMISKKFHIFRGLFDQTIL
jgi:hypothetical protein